MLVIHTLCNLPQKAGHGYGRQMVEYAKRYAAEVGCTTIRIAGYGQILLQGLIEEEQVYLECEVQK